MGEVLETCDAHSDCVVVYKVDFHSSKGCPVCASQSKVEQPKERIDMKVRYGKGTTEYGPGVSIELTGCDVATAIDAYLVAKGIHVSGARTIKVNGELCEAGSVYVDPSGFVIKKGRKYSGRGPAG